MISDEELQAMEERERSATPGPWEPYEYFSFGERRENLNLRIGGVTSVHLIADAEFIAHAREDLPKLIQEVRRLRKENEDLGKK